MMSKDALTIAPGIGQDGESFYEMANLFPKHTGLPFVVWISIRGGARHDVHVKVSPGPKVQPAEMVTVGLRPYIHVVDGTISPDHLQLLTQWLELNREVILQYWREEIDTVDAMRNLRPISSAPDLT